MCVRQGYIPLVGAKCGVLIKSKALDLSWGSASNDKCSCVPLVRC